MNYDRLVGKVVIERFDEYRGAWQYLTYKGTEEEARLFIERMQKPDLYRKTLIKVAQTPPRAHRK